ncbi:trypsin-like serine protease [Amycolatopsis sp. NPDC004378]
MKSAVAALVVVFVSGVPAAGAGSAVSAVNAAKVPWADAGVLDSDAAKAAFAAEEPGFAGVSARPGGGWAVLRTDEAAVARLRARLVGRAVVDTATVRWDFARLYAWKTAAGAVARNLPDVAWIDIDEERNALVVGVVPGGGPRVSNALAEAGIPLAAVEFRSAERPRPAASLVYTVNPRPGGVEISADGGTCSLGVNVVRNGVAGFVTAAHCFSATGTGVNQPSGGSRVGAVSAFGPAYSSGCSTGSNCKHADAVFVAYDSASFQRLGSIALTYGRGQRDISGYGAVAAVQSAPGSGTRISKVGRTTGTTTGYQADRTCVQPNYGTRFTFPCLSVALVEVGQGDSGGPVFSASGGSLLLHGIVSGYSASGEMFYSPWSSVVADLGSMSVGEPSRIN